MAYQPEIEKLEQRYAAEPARNFAQLAEAYRRDGRLDQALDVLRMHLQDRPDYVSGLVVLGRCLIEKQEDAEAQETFEHVLMLDAEHIIALKALAEISDRAGDSDGARNWLQRLLDVDPMNEEAQTALEALGGPGEEPAAAVPAPAETVLEPAAPLQAITGDAPVEAPEEPAPPDVLGFGPTSVDEEPARPPIEETVLEMESVAVPEAESEPEVEAEPEPPPIPPTVAVPAIDLLALTDAPGAATAEPAPPESEGLVIERASAEYDVVPADLEPVDVEQSSEATLPPPPESETAEPEDQAAELGASDATLEAEPVEDLDATAPMFATGPEELADAAPIEPATPPLGGDTVIEEALPEPAEGGLDIEPFDSNLGWGTGERTSRQITSEDIAAAEQAHEETLEEAAVQGLLGMEDTDVPPVGRDAEGVTLETTATPQDVDAEPVPGLEPEEFEPVEGAPTVPLEGLEPTVDDTGFAATVEEPPAQVVDDVTEPEVVAPSFAEPEVADETTVPDLGTEGIVSYDGTAETVRVEGLDVPAAEPPADFGLPVEEETVWIEPTADGEPQPAAEPADAREPTLESEPAAAVEEAEVAPVADEVPAEGEEAHTDGVHRSSLDGIPVFLPDEDEQAAPTGEPEPVVTETMAEVYAKQGLIDEARDVYRQLLEARPDDPRLQERLAELDTQPVAGGKAGRYSAAMAGGESARSFLRSILSGRLAASPPASAEAAVAPEAPPVEVPPPAPLDDAFESDEPDAAAGAPTQPAADEMSLSNVFGDAPAPATPEAEPEAPEAPAGAAPGGFSFDEFFGNRPGQRQSTGEHRPPRDTLADDEGDEAFRNWLKGLKG